MPGTAFKQIATDAGMGTISEILKQSPLHAARLHCSSLERR